MFKRLITLAVAGLVLSLSATYLSTTNVQAAPAKAKSAKSYAKTYMKAKYGWGAAQYKCLVRAWEYESHWNYKSQSKKYLGIPQLNVGFVKANGHTRKAFMKNYKVQVRLGLKYIKKRYGKPCSAWSHIKRTGWY